MWTFSPQSPVRGSNRKNQYLFHSPVTPENLNNFIIFLGEKDICSLLNYSFRYKTLLRTKKFYVDGKIDLLQFEKLVFNKHYKTTKEQLIKERDNLFSSLSTINRVSEEGIYEDTLKEIGSLTEKINSLKRNRKKTKTL